MKFKPEPLEKFIKESNLKKDMNNKTIVLTIGIILILVIAIGVGVWWYSNQQKQQDFWGNIKELCESSGGIYIGAPPQGWMDNREIWIPCNCPEGTQWSFSPNFRCESK